MSMAMDGPGGGAFRRQNSCRRQNSFRSQGFRLPRWSFCRRSWPAFLSRIISPSVWQRLGREDPRRADGRTRWSIKYVVLAWLAMGWSLQAQATARFDEAYQLLARWFFGRRRPGRSYQGLVKASKSIGPGFIQTLWRELRIVGQRAVGAGWRWHGRVVLAMDGSRIDAPRTRANERALGRSGRAKSPPQWHLTQLIHLPTGLLWDWRAGCVAESERGHLRDMLDEVPAEALLVGDAGFVGFDLLCELHGRNFMFLVRCGANVTLLVEDARPQIERGRGQRFVYLWPTKHQGDIPLCLRLIVLRDHGKRVYLLTNELDSTQLSRSAAGRIYAARWGVEVGYRELKQTLQRRKLLSRAPATGAIELAANIAAWALLRLQALVLLGPRGMRLSVAAALRVLRGALEAVRHGQSTTRFFDAFGAALRDTYTRHRPKHARDWPHKKNEPPPAAPKLRRLNPQQLHRLLAFANDPEAA